MHTFVVMTVGIVGLLLFASIAHAVNRRRSQGFVDGGRLFIWIWLVVCVTNFAVGVFSAGISPLIELGIFAVVFGAPTALALLVSQSLRKSRSPKST